MSGPESEREREIRSWLLSQIAEATGLPEQEISVDEPLAGFGLGSRDLVVLSGELEDWLGRPVSPTIVWEFPTIAQLARALDSGAVQ